MASLYEIDQEIMQCLDMETGEIIDPERLDALQMERTSKIENVALWIKNLEADAEGYKKEKTAFAKREKAARNKACSLKRWLATALNGEKLILPRAALSFRKSVAVDIPNEKMFIAWACEERRDLLTFPEPTPNRTAIKEAISNGELVSGAVLAERNNISIR